MAEGASARLADVLGALSFATDLAAGVPTETSLRTCVVATRIARARGLGGAELADVFYAALLRHLGCTSASHEAAHFAAGDDHDLLRTFETIDRGRKAGAAAHAVKNLAAAAPVGERITAVARTLFSPAAGTAIVTAQCDQAAALAKDLGMPAGVVRALGQIYERWDGRGAPSGLAGDAIASAARALHVANVVEVQFRHGGRDAALRELERRRGGALDPDMCDALLGCAASVWAALTPTSVWDAYLDEEPAPARRIHDGELDAVALAFARYADLKSPSHLGHAPAVAALAVRAADAGGFDEASAAILRRAALLHDLGVVSVPNGIWEKKGALNPAEWERVRLHAYYGERILSRVPGMGPVAGVVAMHHERVDGSGYPHGAPTPETARSARVLACADTYHALTQARPHRPARSASDAARVLRDEAAAGRLCARAVGWVLAAAGHAPGKERALPKGLTAREVEVLVLMARGQTNKEIAAALGISPRTAQHHVEHIYAKAGVTTRAAAALFAVRSGLVGDE